VEHYHEGDQSLRSAQHHARTPAEDHLSEPREGDAQQAIATSSISAIIPQPGFTTSLERVKMAKVMMVMGRHSFNACHRAPG